VCFPWFGPGPTLGSALHGFARTAPWSVLGAVEADDGVTVTLALSDADVADGSAWPHPFQARLDVRVGASLTLTLSVDNTGDGTITFQEALHTYLAVGDVRRVRVEGLADQPYFDRLADTTVPPQGAALQIVGETDRVYPQPGTISVVDPVLGRTLTVAASGSANAVVWNPWAAKAAAMPDFGDDEWPSTLCVETCNVLDRAVTVRAGSSSSMSVTFSVTTG
jgi:glucose-6-phosphate 1-epimerase